MNRTPANGAKGSLLYHVLPLLSIGAMIGLWELAFRQGWFNLTFFPPPSQFLRYLSDEAYSVGLGTERVGIVESILASFGRILAGLAVSFVVGLALGMIAATNVIVQRLTLPLVHLLAPIAPIAWIPLGIVLFGLGDSTAVFIVMMGTIFVLTIATVAAVKAVDADLLKTAETLGASPSQRWMHVILPAILPDVFIMLRMNFMGAWMAVLAAEMVGLRNGLGAIVLLGRESSNPNLVLVGMCLIGAAGAAVDWLLRLIQKKALWWKGGSSHD